VLFGVSLEVGAGEVASRDRCARRAGASGAS